MPSLRSPHFVLMIGDDGLVLVPHNIAKATVISTPSHAPHEISTHLARYPQARTTLFVDNLAQDFRSDDLPRLSFFDRAKLIERRLKQAFPSAKLTAAKHFKNTARRVLMIGLHESNPVFIWANRLRERTPAIALVPVEGAHMLARLMPQAAAGWAMMISRQKTGGFRQIVTYKNDLVFTRLTPLPATKDINDTAQTIARDIKASLDYLTRQGLRDPRDLSVLLLMPNDLHTNAAFDDLPLSALQSLSPTQAARQLNLSLDEDDETADVLFAKYLLSRLRPTLTLRLPNAHSQWLNKTISFWGLRLSCACLLLALTNTLWHASSFLRDFYQTQKETLQLQETRQALTQAQNNAAPLTEPLGRLRQALARKHIYEQQQITPWQGLNELAVGFNKKARLIKLEWSATGTEESFTLSVRTNDPVLFDDRAEAVSAFMRFTHELADSMPNYLVVGVKPPYPSMPQESVTTAPPSVQEPLGEISLQRKQP